VHRSLILTNLSLYPFPQSDKQSSTHNEPVGGHQRLERTLNLQNQNKIVSNFGPENGGSQSLWDARSNNSDENKVKA
jgi:hypothetical protein